jgi:sialate O-acetylesterase
MRHLVVCGLVWLSAPLAWADVRLPKIISNHMVLQRNVRVPIWGVADPGERVAVTFRDQEKITVAARDGSWAVYLDSLREGGPETLTIRGRNTVTLRDVLVGEVWIGSGQSNMAGPVAGYVGGDPGLAGILEGTPYPKVRVGRAKDGWWQADNAHAVGFSALLFAFGVNLQKELDVPVGLILGAAGGSSSAPWLTEETFRSDPLCRRQAIRSPTGGNAFGYLYDQYVKPLVPYAIRGVLWDQGESGTGIDGVDQFALMGALIQGWRSAWGQHLTFVMVQKPSGGGPAFDPADPVTRQADRFEPLPEFVPRDAGPFRAVHLRLREHPDTFLVTASDLGSGLHPTNKSGYGARAARVALGGVYGKNVEIYGPIYKSHQVEGDKVRVSFTHVGNGLTFKHGDRLQGFAVAGADGRFQWAEASIAGDTVLLSCPRVPRPVAVRYAWAPTHPWANLFNLDGLPALPFTTDR